MEVKKRKYLEYLETERNCSPNTVLSYENDLNSLIKFLKSKRIESFNKVNRGLLKIYIGFLIEEGYSPRSIGRKIAAVRSFFRYLQKTRIIDGNPSSGLVIPKTVKKIPSFLNEDSIQKLLSLPDCATIQGKRDKAILELFYSTGIRLGELINLNTSDIKEQEGVIKVTGKGKKERIIPVGRKAVQAVGEYIGAKRNENSGSFRGTGSIPVFTANNGKRIYPQAVGRMVRKYIEKVSEIEKKSPHVLRHTFATHLLNRGADVRAVKELLGHESLSTTQIYAHVSTSQMRKVYESAHPKA
jgi:integrase/recombinase XerC